MRIVACEETQTPGNDCLIKDLYSIIEVFNKYEVMHVTMYEGGWVRDDAVVDIQWFHTEPEAKAHYNKIKRR